MKKIFQLTALVLFSNMLFAQQTIEVLPFDKLLNQFKNVRDFCISDGGEEAYFTVQSPNQDISQIACVRKEKNGWGEPFLLPFCNAFMYLEPFLAPGGKRLYFVSDRPLSDSATEKKDFDIWYVERANNSSEWSKPRNIGRPVNTAMDEFYPSVCNNQNLYFTMDSPNGMGKDDIYFCKWENGAYSAPVILDSAINSSGYEFNAFVNRSESFILFTKYNEPDGQGSGDLYVAKKDSDGKWQKAKNLGVPINTKFMEYCPFYDEKNQTLYFTSRRSSLIPKAFKSISEFQQYINEGENGLSKIYKTKLKIE